ncbi:MAG: retention module-containing protein, partial [Betaproteobacteria bacterium]|nr:retention module-containing protein [Betaproteobacteria bacterium]
MATTSSKVLGTIKSIVGEVKATASDGTVRTLQIGDQVFADEVITTSAGGQLIVALANGQSLECGADASLALHEGLLGTTIAAPTPAAPASDVAALQAAIAAGADPTQVAEATAAGAPGAGGPGGDGGSHEPVIVGQANAPGFVTAGFTTHGAGSASFPNQNQQLLTTEPTVSVLVQPQPDNPATPVNESIVVIGDAVSIVEGTNGGTHVINFIISLDHAFIGDVQVTYQVVPGTAQDPSDYHDGPPSNTVTIPAGETQIIIPIQIVQDHLVEANETFSIVLVNAVNATISPTANSVVVTIVDDDLPPLAQSDAYTTAEDTPLTVTGAGILVNDSGAGPGETLTVASHTNPSHGTLTLNADGSFTYTPAADYNGPDSFTYSMTDGFNGTSSATVNINVTSVNDAPVDGNEAHSFTEDSGPFTAGGDALANASDVDGDAMTISAGTGAAIAGTYGTLDLAANGTYTYTLDNAGGAVQGLAAGQVVTDTFNYTVSDGKGGTDASQITITITGVAEPVVVTPQNNPPTTNDTNANGAEDNLGINVNLSGADVDGTVASFTISSLPANGTLKLGDTVLDLGDSVPAAGNAATVTFVPDADWNGITSFDYAAVDNSGAADESPATATITVTSENDPPAGTDKAVTVLEDGVYTFDADDFGFTDPQDVPADALEAVIV